MKNIRRLFPICQKITYLDSSALVLKPVDSIKALVDFYKNNSVSTRTSNSPIGIRNAKVILEVRNKVAQLLDSKPEEIIFTSGTTDSLNKLALMLEEFLKKGDEVLLSPYNHSSNLAPWINLAKKVGAKVIIEEDLLKAISNKTKIIALAQVQNTFETNYDYEAIITKAHQVGAIVVNDAAQAIINNKVSLKKWDAIAFSSNKFYGPTGFGVLAVKQELLSKLKPAFYGGGTIADINENACFTINSANNYEPGTPDLASFYMFNESLNFFNNVGYQKTNVILKNIANYAYKELSKIEGIRLYNSKDSHIILLNYKNYNAQDIAHYLGTKNIYVRSGIFCAQYLKNIKKESSFLRISFGIYNNKKDVDILVKALKEGGDFLVI